MDKEYCALVFTGEAENLPEPGLSVKLEDYLLRDGRKNTSAVVPSGTKDAKRAELVYEVKEKKRKTGPCQNPAADRTTSPDQGTVCPCRTAAAG